MTDYRILVTRTCLGNFHWELIDDNNNKAILQSRQYTSKDMCYKIIDNFSKSFKKSKIPLVEFIDLENDWEE